MQLTSGATVLQAQRDDVRVALKAAVTAMDHQLSQAMPYRIAEEWQPLRGQLMALAPRYAGNSEG